MEREYVTRIENLSEKVRLTTTRKKIGKIVDLKVQNDSLKETTEKLQSRDNKKVNVDRSSSVYDVYDAIRKNRNKYIEIESISNKEKYDDLQVFIRAGMTDQLENLTKRNNISIESMKFLIFLRLNTAYSQEEKDASKTDRLINTANERKNFVEESTITSEDETVNSSIKNTTNCLKNSGKKKIDQLSRDSTLPTVQGNATNKISSYNTNLHVNILQLAIISRQKTSVQWIINNILNEQGDFHRNTSSFQSLLNDTVFMSNASLFNSKDQILHGMNVFHLSSYYFPEALEIIFESIDFHYMSSTNVLKNVRDNENVFQYTPLHIAARKSSYEAARYLIDNGAKVDTIDIFNQTPLHLAVKSGNENLVLLLLQHNEGPPNQVSKFGRTPLHLSKTPAATQLLIDDGADPYIKNDRQHDPFDYLLKHNGKSAEVVLDNYITTNDKELDSCDLLIVYNLKCFDGDDNEFSRHSTMFRHNPKLLYHPISEAMIRLKWSCLSNAYKTFIILKLIFVSSLTWLVAMQSSYMKQSCSLGFNTTNSSTIKVALSDYKSFPFLYIISTLSLSILLCLEMTQLLMVRTKQYFLETKNWMDMIMMLLTVAYFSSNYKFFFYHSPDQGSRQEIGAVCILLAWMYLVMAFRHTPKVGIYLHMVKNVSSTLFFFLLMYAPTLVAFSLCFYVLMPCEKDFSTFENPWKSGLKILAMLIGEFDYEGNFITLENPNIILIQIISVLFLFFGTIVIMNLLVGLAVNEIDQLKSEALHMSLQEKVSCIIPFQELLSRRTNHNKDRAMKENSLCFNFFLFLFGRFDLFSTLRKLMKAKIDERKNNHLKLCIQPAGVNDIKRINHQICGYRLPIKKAGYPVYFFDDQTMKRGEFTDFTFPKELADRTMEQLEKKESFIEELRKKISNDIFDQ